MSVRLSRVLLASLLALTAGVAAAPVAAAAPRSDGNFPVRIDLPAGFSPEGISSRSTTFFVGSRADGAIYRGSLRTGEGGILVPGTEGGFAAGTEVDGHRLWVAGGGTGTGTVYDTRTGDTLASFAFDTSGTSFLNDVVVTRDAAYYTDSRNDVLHVVPFRGRGTPGTPSLLQLKGEFRLPTDSTSTASRPPPTADTCSLSSPTPACCSTSTRRPG